jgi:transposase
VRSSRTRAEVPGCNLSPFFYRYRNLIVERSSTKLKHFRAVTTRQDKRADNSPVVSPVRALWGYRRAADRRGLRYPRDLTDGEWGLIAPLVPAAKRGGRRRQAGLFLCIPCDEKTEGNKRKHCSSFWCGEQGTEHLIGSVYFIVAMSRFRRVIFGT